MSDDTPTQRFDAQAPASERDRRSRLPLILGIAGGILLLIIVLLILLLGTKGAPRAGGTNSPTSSASPTVAPVLTPSPTRTATAVAPPTAAPPANTNVTITGYSISPAKIDCGPNAPADGTDLHITWHSINGKTAYFGVNAGGDAEANGMGWMLPPNGTQHDFPAGYDPYQFLCSNASQNYTITVVGPTGKVSKTVTVYRK